MVEVSGVPVDEPSAFVYNQGMTTLVTGASGHVGGNLVRALLAAGRKVRVLVYDDDRALEGLEVERVRGDVLDFGTIEKAIEGVSAVYHLAVVISVDGDRDGRMLRTNVEGTRNVVRACLEAGVRMVHFSSVHAFSAIPVDGVVDETRAQATGEHAIAYDLTKVAAENEVLAGIEEGLSAVIVNPGGVIGPCDFKPGAMGEVLLALCRGKMPGLVDAGFNWVDVRDVALGAMAAEADGGIGERYLLVGHWVSFKDLADEVAKHSGVPRPKLVSPLWLASIGVPFAAIHSKITGARPLFTHETLKVLKGHRHVSHEKATKKLGYLPRPFAETVADTVNWYKEVGWI